MTMTSTEIQIQYAVYTVYVRCRLDPLQTPRIDPKYILCVILVLDQDAASLCVSDDDVVIVLVADSRAGLELLVSATELGLEI